MICELEYSELNVKELCARAMINRKTFYLHYESLDALFAELENEIVEGYTKQTISYKTCRTSKKSSVTILRAWLISLL